MRELIRDTAKVRRTEYPAGSVIFADLTVVTYNIRRMFPKRPFFTTSLDSSPTSLADDANSDSLWLPRDILRWLDLSGPSFVRTLPRFLA